MKQYAYQLTVKHSEYDPPRVVVVVASCMVNAIKGCTLPGEMICAELCGEVDHIQDNEGRRLPIE
jgi:hypothetical protein